MNYETGTLVSRGEATVRVKLSSEHRREWTEAFSLLMLVVVVASLACAVILVV